MATVIEKEKSSGRILNFGAGPAVLPEVVLEEAQRDLLSLPGVGMSILEISHRSKTFEEILEGAIADIRKLAAIPPNYRILFLGGGASLQFSMVPMNLLAPDRSAVYVVTGSWSKKAVKEAKKVGGVSIAATTEAGHRVLSHGGEVSGFTASKMIFPDDRAAITVLGHPEASAAASEIAARVAPVLLG